MLLSTIYPSAHTSTHPSIFTSCHLQIYQPIHLTAENLFIYITIHMSINISIHPCNHLPNPFAHPSIHLPIHLISKLTCYKSLLTNINFATMLQRLKKSHKSLCVKSLEQSFFTSALNKHKLSCLNGSKWMKNEPIFPPALRSWIQLQWVYSNCWLFGPICNHGVSVLGIKILIGCAGHWTKQQASIPNDLQSPAAHFCFLPLFCL